MLNLGANCQIRRNDELRDSTVYEKPFLHVARTYPETACFEIHFVSSPKTRNNGPQIGCVQNASFVKN